MDEGPGLSADEQAVDTVAAVMRPLGLWWALAGGWAIDLWVGGQTRPHHDVEVVVARADQTLVWDALHESWELSCLDPPGGAWTPWQRERPIAPPAFQCKARAPSAPTETSTEFDLFLESTTDDEWQFRRDPRIRRPIADVTTTTRAGLPIVRPEVQLLYMAKSEEPKNQHDFALARPALDHASARWLRDALATFDPRHRWLAALSGA